MKIALTVFCLMMFASTLFAHQNYTGYSGGPGSSGTCAGSCHGQGGGTISVFGFPASYAPSQTYLITVRKLSGSTIRNFNGSCRVGTGTQNAGTISSGLNSSTYNVSGETNGIHMASQNHDSARFSWIAPAAGTGAVRLYVAGLQGNESGQNTVISLLSTEAAASPPLVASSPVPADSASVANIIQVSWTVGLNTSMQDVHFGTADPPPFIDSVTSTVTSFPVVTIPGQHYFWKINERNSAGLTPGPVWSFNAMLPPPVAAGSPVPLNGATAANVSLISWTVGQYTAIQDVYFGTSDPPVLLDSVTASVSDYAVVTSPGQQYFWRIDERNASGLTTGTVWSFTAMSLAGQASNPNPDEADTVSTPQVQFSWTAGSGSESHQVYLGNPLELVGTVSQPQFSLMLPAQGGYSWRVDEVNPAGTTTGEVWHFVYHVPDAADWQESAIPSSVALGPVYPNPFNAVVVVPFSLPKDGHVRLEVFDVQGRMVAALAEGIFAAGYHHLTWSADGVGSGLFLMRLSTSSTTLTAKVIALK